jgi:parallel beta-helix repeat protein
MRHIIAILAVLGILASVGFAVNLSSCSQVNAGGYYNLIANPTGDNGAANDYACFSINGSNVVFDCAGHTITGTGSNPSFGKGIEINANNVTVENCAGISSYAYGIRVHSGQNTITIKNNTVANGTLGVTGDDVSYLNVNGNTIFNVSFGIENAGMTYSNFTSNTVQGGLAAISLSYSGTAGCSYNNYVNNNLYNCLSECFDVEGSSSAFNQSFNNFTGNTIHDSAFGIGIYFTRYTMSNLLSNNHYYNLTQDIKLNNFVGGAMSYRIANDIFDSNGGTYANYTNLSVYDSLAPGDQYYITWDVQPAGLPFHELPFGQKFVDIYPAFVGNDTIDSINWTYSATDASGHNESNLMVYGWEYNTSYSGWKWDNPVATLDTPSRTLSVSNLVTVNPGFGTTPNTYGILEYLPPVDINISLVSPNEGAMVGNSTVTFNFTPIDSQLATMSCSLTVDGNGVSGNGSVQNDTLTTFTASGLFNGPHNWYVSCSDDLGNTGYSVTRNFTVNISNGCPLINSPGTYLLTSDGSGTANDASDYAGGYSSCVKITSSNVVLDCNGFNVANDGTYNTFGIYVDGYSGSRMNVTIRNCLNIVGYDEGVYIYNGTNDTISNSRAYSGSDGFKLDSGVNNTVVNCTAFNDSTTGFTVDSDLTDLLANNTAYNNPSNGFELHDTLGTFTGNSAYNNSADGFSIASDAQGDFLSGNMAHGNTGAGIRLFSTVGNILFQNTAYNNTDGFIDSSTGSQGQIQKKAKSRGGDNASKQVSDLSFAANLIVNNTAYGNSGEGFFVYRIYDDTLLNNTAYGNLNSGFMLQPGNTNTTLDNNVAHGNSRGFRTIYHSGAFHGYSTISNSTAYGNSFAGFDVGTNSVILTNDTTYNNPYGIYMDDVVTLEGNTIYGNSMVGAYGNEASPSFTGDRFYNNAVDLDINESIGNHITVNLAGVVFANPSGTGTDYTNLTVSDDAINEEYSINWSASPPTFPPGKASFHLSFVNISALYGDVSIDSINWTWQPSQLVGYDMNSFELWKYDFAGWSDTGAVLYPGLNTISLSGLNPASTFGVFENSTLANLTIYSQYEYSSVAKLNPITFYANFTNATSGAHISGATCLISFDDATNGSMVDTGSQYNYTKAAGFSTTGSHTWTVLCSQIDYGALSATDGVMITALNESGNMTSLYMANVTNATALPRFVSNQSGNLTTQGGNITGANVGTVQLTDRWAAFYGNISGKVILTDKAGLNNVFQWGWSTTAGGVVCTSTNSSVTNLNLYPADGDDIDTAWSFGSSEPDSGRNTFNQTPCDLTIGTTTIYNASYVDTGQPGGFVTCSLKDTITPPKAGMFFCTAIEPNGTFWNNQTGNFELMVPTAFGVNQYETYYFYVNLN